MDLEVEVVAEIPKGTSLDDESVKAEPKTESPVVNKKTGWFSNKSYAFINIPKNKDTRAMSPQRTLEIGW